VWPDCVVVATPFFDDDPDHGRYHEGLGNVTPADAYFGRDRAILSERRKIKEKTMKQHRLINRKHTA
jgi:hypothetical protein